MKKGGNRLLWIVMGGLVALCAVWLLVLRLTEPVPRTRPTVSVAELQRQHRAIADAKEALLKTRVITAINCQNREVQVDGLAWDQTPVDTKRDVVKTLGRICQAETKDSHVVVIDNRSGRKLANYSDDSGTELF